MPIAKINCSNIADDNRTVEMYNLPVVAAHAAHVGVLDQAEADNNK